MKNTAFNDVKKSGLDKGCIKCRKVVNFDAIDFVKTNSDFEFWKFLVFTHDTTIFEYTVA